MSCRYVNALQKCYRSFSFFYVDLYDAIVNHDIIKAEDVCKKSKGTLSFSKSLIFVVENNMVDAFNILWKYGAQFSIYGDIAKKLILTALIKQNSVLCEKLLSVGITKNTNPIPSFFSDILEIFPNKIIHVYNKIQVYFVEDKFQWSLVEKPLIHYVIEKNDWRFCEFLIKHNFGVDSRDNSGNLPVHVAARVGDGHIMKQLIESNATIINATNHANQVPLHLAAKNGHKEVFDILKSFGAEDLKDNDGNTPEDYAQNHNHYDKLYVEYLSFYS